MRVSRLLVLLVVAGLVTACSLDTTEEVTARVQQDVRCANYQIERQGYTRGEDDLPVMEGITASQVTENCKLEIVAMHEVFPEGIPESDRPARSSIVGLPEEITDGMRVRHWYEIEKEEAKKSQVLVVPAYTFQCQVDEDIDPAFECDGFAATGHKLSTYTEEAFEISGEGVIPLEVVNLSFSAGNGVSQRDTYVQVLVQKAGMTLSRENPTVWTALLVMQTEWERIGTAEVCWDGPNMYCGVVKARVVHNETYVLGRTTQAWSLGVDYFRDTIRKPAFQFIVPEPEVPRSAIRRDYPGGPMTQVLGGPIRSVTVGWENTDTRLLRRNLTQSVTFLFKSEFQAEKGTEKESSSTAEISYVPRSSLASSGPRCFELFSVGGRVQDNPVTGMILREGCTR